MRGYFYIFISEVCFVAINKWADGETKSAKTCLY